MKPYVHYSLPKRSLVVRSNVAGWAALRIPWDELPSLRQQLGLLKGARLPSSFLKQCDEQTIAGVGAVTRAIDGFCLDHYDFTSWGVIAAPRFLGRTALAASLARYKTEGAWGISPHLIPHRSLHSLSGTISQALKIHGPNYGVGGGAQAAPEALIAAGAMLADQGAPGIWLVLTGFEPELVPVESNLGNAPATPTVCLAVALALVPAGEQRHLPHLSIAAMSTPGAAGDDWPPFTLETCVKTFACNAPKAQWSLPGGGWAAWDFADSPVEICS